MKTQMKLQIIALCSMIALGTSQAAMATDETPATREVTVGVSDVFVPGGFDSETDSYVVASGIFPNGCYRWKGAEVKNVDAYRHEVKSTAIVSQGMCLMVLIPFTKEIRLGRLASGNHTLKFINGDGTYLEKSLKVE